MSTLPSLKEERALRRAGFARVAGIDEAGRGAWAGPVVAAAVILPVSKTVTACLRGVKDSKQLTAGQREEARRAIEETAIALAVGRANPEEIDMLGVVPATRLAMTRAITSLTVAADALLIDALSLPDLQIHQNAFNFADSLSLSVAAASIMAKTERDAIMRAADESLPGYGFALHKGYGTRAHAAALQRLGVSPLHRRSFKPIQLLMTDD